METLRDPYHVITVINSVGGLGFAYWTTTKLKELTDIDKEFGTKLEALGKTVAELTDAVKANRQDVQHIATRIGGINQELAVNRKNLAKLDGELADALESITRLGKAEKTRDPKFKVLRSKGKPVKKARYESDSESDSEDDRTEDETDSYKGKRRRDDRRRDDRRRDDREEEEVIMRRRDDRRRDER